jgi:hypothetical protein
LTLHEVAHNRFPFPPEGEPPLGGPIELLNFIVAQPVPRLIDSPEQRVVWTHGAQDFLAQWWVSASMSDDFVIGANVVCPWEASFGQPTRDHTPGTC